MVQAGIKRFVFPHPDADKLERWAESFIATKRVLDECHILWTEIGEANDYSYNRG
jgi:hypothetical protein